MRHILIIATAVAATALASCGNSEYTPKPRGYPRIYFPEHSYRIFSSECPYEFSYPVYADMLKNPAYTVEPCWYNMFFKPFNATLHLSYKHYNSPAQFDSLFNDTRKLAYKHTIKAEEIEEIEISKGDSMQGLIYELKGNTATNLNFYVCDGKQHFLRGALYFNAKTQTDSIAPVFNFLKQDIYKMIETVRWKY